MTSLIRVRGKRGNKALFAEEIESVRKRSRIAHSQYVEIKSDSFSHLEALPTELLERILYFSKNLALLIASRRLRTALNTPRILERTIMGQFYEVGFFRPIEAPYAMPASGSLSVWKRLISHPAFRFRWLERHARDWMYEVIERDVHRYWNEAGVLVDEKLSQRLAFVLDRMLYQHRLSGLPLGPKGNDTIAVCKDEVFVFATEFFMEENIAEIFSTSAIRVALPSIITDVANLKIFLSGMQRKSIMSGLHAPTNPGFLQIIHPKSLQDYDIYESLYWPWDRNVTMWSIAAEFIPHSLCRPPFTQDKGDMLKYLLDLTRPLQRAEMPSLYGLEMPPPGPQEPQGPIRALQRTFSCGLADALRMGCLPAIYCLGNGHFGASSPSFLPASSGSIHCEQMFCGIHLFGKKPRCVRGFGTEQAANPWLRLSGRAPLLCYGLQVLIEDEHIRICIDNFHRDPDVYWPLLHDFLYRIFEFQAEGEGRHHDSTEVFSINLSTDTANALFLLAKELERRPNPPVFVPKMLELYKLTHTNGLWPKWDDVDD